MTPTPIHNVCYTGTWATSGATPQSYLPRGRLGVTKQACAQSAEERPDVQEPSCLLHAFVSPLSPSRVRLTSGSIKVLAPLSLPPFAVTHEPVQRLSGSKARPSHCSRTCLAQAEPMATLMVNRTVESNAPASCCWWLPLLASCTVVIPD